ncbi:ATP-grasp domain-containing protein [Corynebacterium sp. NPDC060344]|uniref:ATP-grasp domain-containing protein n=1 Tax=Corynebacterium sp. NPDC060344 TaxID=3347101 RepID=UPI003653DB56
MPYVAVVSSRHLPATLAATLRPDDFDHIFYADDYESVAALAAALPDDIVGAAIGTEIDVHLFDLLCAELGVPGNDPATSDHRIDKYGMVQAMRAAGVPAIPTLLTSDLSEALSWVDGRGEVVVKPSSSAGSDSVYFCREASEVERAFGSILGQVNQMGRDNDAVLLQERIFGRQFVVNAVSTEGRHYVVEAWNDRRRAVPGHGVVHDFEELLPADDPDVAVLSRHLLRCLDAMGFRNGPSHAEMMLTERGPLLIEVGPRVQGSVLSAPVEYATGGRSHASSTLDAAIDGFPSAAEATGAVPEYRVERPLRMTSLISPVDGTVNSADHLAPVLDDPRTKGVLGHLEPGVPVRRTIDLFTSPGAIYVTGADAGDVEDAYQGIRAREDDITGAGLYVPDVGQSAAPEAGSNSEEVH